MRTGGVDVRRRPVGPATLLLALVGLLFIALPSPEALAGPPRTVTVIDEAEQIEDADEFLLEGFLQSVVFRTDVDLVALTIDVTDHGLRASDDEALDEAVLSRARQDDPEWIDGRVWADGLIIIAIDQDNRFVGSYSGEDVALSKEDYTAVEDAMKTAARAGETDAALLDGTERYAQLLDRPWWTSPTALAIGGGTVVVLVLLGAVGMGAGARARGLADCGRGRWNVLAPRDEAVRAAIRAIPRFSRCGGPLLAVGDRWELQRERAAETAARMPLSPRALWGVLPWQQERARTLDEATRSALADADLLTGGTTLLRLRDGWVRQWEVETGPLTRAGTALEELLRESGWLGLEGADEPAVQSSRAELLATGRVVDERLAEATRGLTDGQLGVEDALAALDEITELLAGAVLRHVEARISASAQDETATLRDAAEAARLRTAQADEGRSLRTLLRDPELGPVAADGGPGGPSAAWRASWATGMDPVRYLQEFRDHGSDQLSRLRWDHGKGDRSGRSGWRRGLRGGFLSGGLSGGSFRGSGSSSRF